MSAAYYPQVQKIYVAYYGRPADPAGLQYWAGQLAANGGNLTSIINAFGNSAESTALYAGASDSAKVTAIYQQLFNRAPDSAGLAFYTAELTAGRMTAASIALNVANGAQGTDATYLANKVTVGTAFTDALTVDSAAAVAYTGTTATTAARSLITGVTTSAATTNVASTITSIKSGGGAAAGQTFTLTTSADSFPLTSGNDTVTGASGTLSSDDIVLDTSLTDNDVFTATVANNSTAPRIQYVETVNINGVAAVTGVDLADSLGIDTLNLNTGVPQGTATVTNASSLNAAQVNIGANVRTVSVTATASGTRDTVAINAGSARTVTAAGGAGADNFDVTLAAAASATIDGDGSIDEYIVRLSGSATVTGDVATENVTFIYNGSDTATVTQTTNEMNADYAEATDYQVRVQGSGDVTFSGDDDVFDAKKIVNEGTGTVTVDVTSATDAKDYSQLAVDVLELSTAAAGAVEVDVSTITSVNLDADIGQVLTLNNAADADTANQGQVTVTLSQDQTKALTAGNEVGTITISATPDTAADTAAGDDIDLAELDTDTNGATTVIVTGSNDLTITLWDGNADDVLYAGDMTGNLTISDTEHASSITLGSGDDTISDTINAAITIVNAGAGDDTVTFGTGAANEAYGEDGDDTLTGNSGAELLDGGKGDDSLAGGGAVDTITGGDGDDTIDGGAGADDLTGGAGSDEFRIVSGEDDDTITDFDTSKDVLVLTGAVGGDIDLGDVTITDAELQWDGNFEATLTGVSATDTRGFVQLGRSALATAVGGAAVEQAVTYTAFTSTNDDVTAGDQDDVIQPADVADTGSIATGGGSDIIIAVMAATGVLEITDFVKGTDRIIFTGTADSVIDVSAATVAAGEYTFDDNSIVNLSNGGTALTATDMSDSIQLGTAANVFTVGDAGTVQGGRFNDYVAGVDGKANVINFVDNGGVDTLTVFKSTEDDLSFDDMTGIGATGTVIAANAAKVADAVSGSVYIFADGSDGVGSQSVDFNGEDGDVGLGSAEVLADVAAFLDAALGTANGENYVTLINTTQGGTDVYAIYYVSADADGIQADDIRLIGSVDADADLVAGDIA